jgi:hypothetical protein
MKTKIIDFLKKIWSNPDLRTFVLLTTIVVLALLYAKSCSNRKQDAQTYAQNEVAYKNELKAEENKNGDLQTSVETWEGKTKDLDKYSKDLANELEAVKKSKVKVITKTKVVYSPADTIEIDNTLDSLGNNEYRLNWSYTNADSSRLLEGESRFFAELLKPEMNLSIIPGKTMVNKDEISLVLVVGIKKNKKTGFDEVFVTPKTPGVTVAELEGGILDPPKKKKFGVGVGVGYGIGLDSDSRLRLTPTININLSRLLFAF